MWTASNLTRFGASARVDFVTSSTWSGQTLGHWDIGTQSMLSVFISTLLRLPWLEPVRLIRPPLGPHVHE
jgi:hypothetical protein